MQLHPGPHTLPWHSTADSSDLSIQWNQLSRHYSTDRSSSLGSMESLDPPSSQVYYDSHNSPVDPAIFNNKREYESHNSPVDPAIFNNKRDSAYSSFSASSNTSDYTVSLRPGEACSMENILQSLGPGGPVCRGDAYGDAPSLRRESDEAKDDTGTSGLALKSKSLIRPRVWQSEAKERPSSCCYEEERKEFTGERGREEGEKGVSSPPEPPTRKDSFRATRGRSGITGVKDQRCISAPVEIPSLSCCHTDNKADDDSPQTIPSVQCRKAHPTPCETQKTEGDLGKRNGNRVENFKGDSLEQYYSLISKKKGSRAHRKPESHQDPLNLPSPERNCNSPIPSTSPLPPHTPIEPDTPGEPNHLPPQNKHSSSVLHRHSAPEKLLSQLRLLEFSSDPSKHSDPSSVLPSSSLWSHSPLHPNKDDLGEEHRNQGMWGGSRCSTPGSVDIDRVGEVGESLELVAAAVLSPIQVQHPWGRSVSVPGTGEPSSGPTMQEVSSERVREKEFVPLSVAASVDSLLLENRRGGGEGGVGRDDNEGEVLIKKPRSHRSSRTRRRSERFATNLRNEIQRKKAQLSKGKGPAGLLYGGETVEEEGGPEPQDSQGEEADNPDPSSQERSSQGRSASADTSLSTPAPRSQKRLPSALTPQVHQPSPISALPSTRDEDPGHPENEYQATDPPRTTQKFDPMVRSCHLDAQVVEEPAPAGKARRWRWTPEHKLQPEMDTDQRGEKVSGSLGVSGRGRASSTSSASSCSSSTIRSSRTEENDILPFADRCKFFEETSRSVSVSNLPGLTSRKQRPERHGRQPYQSVQAQRRYSYQGGIQQETLLSMNTTEANRHSARGNREEREREEREMERERDREERERDREERERDREEREREREERGWVLEREEMARERERERVERTREREVREQEERIRQREMEKKEEERQREEGARLREMEEERQREERARLREMEEERQREEGARLRKKEEEERQREEGARLRKKEEEERQREEGARLRKKEEEERQREEGARLREKEERQREEGARLREKEERQREEGARLREEEEERQREEGARLREKEEERQREERARLRQLEMEREREREIELERERERNKERQKDREEKALRSAQDICVNHTQPQDHAYFHPQAQIEAPRSAFHLVNTPLDRDHQGHPPRSYTPTEAYPAVSRPLPRGQTQINRKFSLTERDNTRYRRDSATRPPDGAITSYHQPVSQSGGDWSGQQSACGMGDEAHHQTSVVVKSSSLLRSRAMSENDLRFESTYRRASPSAATAEPLSVLEEGGGFRGDRGRVNIKKAPPPPRPPPPKWEQFHQGPASYPSCHPEKTEMTRQRSFSLPPQKEELEGCQHCSRHQVQERPFSQVPPSPRFARMAFRPVVVSDRQRDTPFHFNDTQPPLLLSDSCARLCHTDDQDHPAVLKPTSQRQQDTGADWERTPSPRVHRASGLATMENGGILPESYFALSYEQQQQLQHNRRFRNQVHNDNNNKLEPDILEPESALSPSPAQSLEQEVDIPMETDIDEFQEEGLLEDEEPIRTELQCFALPVRVLETDIDTLPDQHASPAGRLTAGSGSLDGEMEDQGMRTREGLMQELFPQSGEGEAGFENCRGAYRSPNQEHNTDSLDRRSGASSSCSSYYSTSAAKAQLLSQMKDYCSDTRDTDDDDELSYKRQLMESLRKKLGVLREAQRGLLEDIRANAQLGEEVESLVLAVCKPNEVDKFRMFIGDLDKVVSLLLSLSGRLLRVESSLDNLDTDTRLHERLPLLEKKRQLLLQLSEAQDLKEHVDRREQAVGRVLGRCLSPEQHRDYSHYVKMKAALLVEQRQLEDKIRLGEEQLRALRESLGLGLGMGLGMSIGYGHY
uniref:ASD2 domain-containing protein n=1 Tax=Esox lucius TaxID=8010 RepID=A0A3P8Y872_ESOLU